MREYNPVRRSRGSLGMHTNGTEALSWQVNESQLNRQF